METKSVYNRHLIRSILIGLLCFLLIYLTYAFEIDEVYFTVFLALFGFVFIILSPIFMPYKFIFSKDGITFKYLFSKDEVYMWSNISDIHVVYQRVFGDSYELWEKCTAERKSVKQPMIPKSRKTKRLIEEYYKREII